jgi:hypothetical protein
MLTYNNDSLFNIDIVHLDALPIHLETKAEEIAQNAYGKDSRSYDQIYTDSVNGLLSENHLVNKFKDLEFSDTWKYDLVDSKKRKFEVKSGGRMLNTPKHGRTLCVPPNVIRAVKDPIKDFDFLFVTRLLRIDVLSYKHQILALMSSGLASNYIVKGTKNSYYFQSSLAEAYGKDEFNMYLGDILL